MALIGHLFAIAFGLLVASLVAGGIVAFALLFPEFSDFNPNTFDMGAINTLVAFGFIFVSGFALWPAVVIVLITEVFNIRSLLVYAIGGGIVGAACYLGLTPFDTDTMQFNGIVRRHLEIMTGAGILAGVIYWMIAGRTAGLWRRPRRAVSVPPQLPPVT